MAADDFDSRLARSLEGQVEPPRRELLDNVIRQTSTMDQGEDGWRTRFGGVLATAALVVVGTALFIGVLMLRAMTPSSNPQAGAPVVGVAEDSSFRLTVRVAKAKFSEGDVIPIEATLEYLGPESSVVVVGSSSGLVGFGLAADNGLEVEPGFRSDCGEGLRLERGTAIRIPFVKSGGFSEDDPNASFLREYFSSPALRLPEGAWTARAIAPIFVGDCAGQQVELEADARFRVTP